MPADEADAVLELVFAVESGIANLGAVVVDGIGSVAQEFGNLGAGINTQTDEGEDSAHNSPPTPPASSSLTS